MGKGWKALQALPTADVDGETGEVVLGRCQLPIVLHAVDRRASRSSFSSDRVQLHPAM